MFSINEQKAIELGESGEKAVREQNEYDALQYVEYLREFAEELLSADFETDLKRVAISLRNIGNKAVQKNFGSVASGAVEVVDSLAGSLVEKDLQCSLVFLKTAQEIGKGAAQVEMPETAENAVKALEKIGRGAVEKGWKL